MGLAAEIASSAFLGPTTTKTNPVISSVGTSVAQVLNADPDRVRWVIFNLGDFRMFLDFTQGVSATRGIPVEAGTGFAVSEALVDGEEVGFPVFAVAPGGTTNILVYSTEAVPRERP